MTMTYKWNRPETSLYVFLFLNNVTAYRGPASSMDFATFADATLKPGMEQVSTELVLVVQMRDVKRIRS